MRAQYYSYSVHGVVGYTDLHALSQHLVVRSQLDWSVEFVGEFRFGELAERVIQGQFSGSEGSETIRFSHRDFCFVV